MKFRYSGSLILIYYKAICHNLHTHHELLLYFLASGLPLLFILSSFDYGVISFHTPEKNMHLHFIAETDELLDFEQAIGDPLVPYHPDLPCFHWRVIEHTTVDEVTAGDANYPTWLKSLGVSD